MADFDFVPYLVTDVPAGRTIVGLTFVDEDIWVTDYLDDANESTVRRLDSDGNTVFSFNTTNFASKGGLAWDGTFLYLIGRAIPTGLFWLNRYTLAGVHIGSTIVSITANGIEYAAGFLWISSQDAVDKFSKWTWPPPPLPIIDYQTVGARFYGIAYHNSLLWLGNWLGVNQRLHNYGLDGVADTVYTTNLSIRGLASDGIYLYAVDGTNQTIYREAHLILDVSSVPVDEISIEFDPTPDIEDVASPQDTSFELRYDIGEDITVVAPATDPPDYRWLYWNFGEDDYRSNKIQEFALDVEMAIIATYEAVAGKLCHFSCADGTIHAYYSDTDNNLRLRIVQRSNGTQLEDFAITSGEDDTFPYVWQRCSGMQLYEECLFQRNSNIYHTYNPGGGIEGSWSEPVMAIAGYDLLAACDIPPEGAALILMLLDDEIYYAYANRAVDGSINWGPVTPALITGDAFPSTPEQGASLEFGLDGKFTLTWFDSDSTIYISKSYDGIEWGEL